MAAARASTSEAAAENATGQPAIPTLDPPFVLLDDNLTPGGRARLYSAPVEIVCCETPAQVPAALQAIAGAPARGLHAAGFVAYELGYLLEDKLAPLLPPRRARPLLWMGLFAAPADLDGAAVAGLLAAHGGDYRLGVPRPALSRQDYLAGARRVQDYIAAGDVYQINLTFKTEFDFAGDPVALYRHLRQQQPVAHGALLRTGAFDVLSLSPELFVSVRDGQALTKPMKGTAARAATPEQDAARRAWLRGDEKSRAENLMIVDLLRNDLGRVAEIGSVRVPELFCVETYPTVHQMTSTVTGRLRPAVGVRELIGALFPCGSVTGAPKVRAMQIIRELEAVPRGIYTGAIGAAAPNGDVAFNVAIRTLVLDRDGRGEMGIGSGIVHDSDAAAEFEECLLKAHFLKPPLPPFELIETLRWSAAEGYYLLEAHLARLAASAAHFGTACDPQAVRRALDKHAESLGAGVFRVRLLLSQDGRISLAATAIPPPSPATVTRYAVSERPTESGDDFLYHKTTRREFYDSELARLTAATGCDEVIFCNQHGELTEGSRTNLFVEMDGRLLTPPVSCGLLPGTLRQTLLADPQVAIAERVLVPADLARADRIFLGNSVRGLVPARPADAAAPRVAKG